ncbi:hypothetical protein Q5H93_06195 [Hymenobacter sp. ASUV-10]|uniref:Uncharacterized protein n=1 Tax=Hymenobacter aranciens TaxID=3063996 RepID=A0ABT9BC87_9BACT|nr:hypothetical protein [Hymenobacter sp. ASUV-10]MDO7874316.1 hypothetical protein [Hymenobacter sp. ASUV-10]
MSTTHDDVLNNNEPTPPEGGGLVPVRPKRGRQTEAMTEARRLKLLEMRLACRPRSEQLAYYVNELGLSESSFDQDVAYIRKHFLNPNATAYTAQERVESQVRHYERLAEKAEAARDYRGAADIRHKIDKLFKLVGPSVAVQVNNITQQAPDLTSLPVHDLEAMEAILAKAMPTDVTWTETNSPT